MKIIFLILFMVVLVDPVIAVQPARKPFIQLIIDGKSFKVGDILTVTPGQKLRIEAHLEGGRRDFCKFPDTYSDISGAVQILSRGENGISYILNGNKSEWKLLNEDYSFDADEFAKIIPSSTKSSAELIVSDVKFSQSILKISVKAIWQFIQDDKTSKEENTATATVYLKVAGTSDIWFATKNVQVSGIINEQVQIKLNEVQQACDSIENDLFKLNFSAAQQAIRNLQASVNSLKSTIDEVKAGNPSYKLKVSFLGLPSDRPYGDIELLSKIKTQWVELDSLVTDMKQQVAKLPAEPTKENKDELILLISKYVDWQYNLPEKTSQQLTRYISEFYADNFKMPGHIHYIAEEKTVTDYPKTLNDVKTFIDQRIEEIPEEIQKINAIHTRLQAIRIFDGMLRSYFSSILWSEWISNRGY